jgi:transcription initiation factor TFIIIB Brf1 subunit/transcription initiation factor TFIIB
MSAPASPPAAAAAQTAPTPERARQAVRLLREAGVKLDLSDEAIASAAVFFHRFYAGHSPAEFRCETMTMACLFLSAKASEQQRKARDVINVFNAISSEARDQPMPINQEFWDRKDLLVEYESYLLRALAFDVEVALPHRYLLNYARSLRAPRALVQVAWGLANDYFETALCVRTPPQAVACAALQLAALMLRITLPFSGPAASSRSSSSSSSPALDAGVGHARGRGAAVSGRAAIRAAAAAAAPAGDEGRGRGRGSARGSSRGRGRGRAAMLRAGTPQKPGEAAAVAAGEPQLQRSWHDTFGVSLATLEKVAGQIASNYPDADAEKVAPPPRHTAATSPAQATAGVGDSAKRPRLEPGEAPAPTCPDGGSGRSSNGT